MASRPLQVSRHCQTTCPPEKQDNSHLKVSPAVIVVFSEVCVQLSQPGTVALVCERCSPAEPAHVKIEGSRLLAGLVKYCQSEGALS